MCLQPDTQILILVFSPTPQVTVHFEKGLQGPKTGQANLLHGLEFLYEPLQPLPDPLGKQVRMRFLTPMPHVTEHSPHSDHLLK